MKTETESTPQAPADDQPQTKFPYHWSRTGFFDVAPLLNVVTHDSSPSFLARTLDRVIGDLTEHYLANDAPSDAGHTIFLLRSLRDALTRSVGVFSLDGPSPEEEEWENRKMNEAIEKQIPWKITLHPTS